MYGRLIIEILLYNFVSANSAQIDSIIGHVFHFPKPGRPVENESAQNRPKRPKQIRFFTFLSAKISRQYSFGTRARRAGTDGSFSSTTHGVFISLLVVKELMAVQWVDLISNKRKNLHDKDGGRNRWRRKPSFLQKIRVDKFDLYIKWNIKKVKSLFKLKSNNPHTSCKIYEGTSSCGETYIGETKRNVEVRWSEHNSLGFLAIKALTAK